MPRYDYKCPVCFVTFEAITPSDIDTLPCISCNSSLILREPVVQAKRQLCSPASIHIH